jgi:hypothetical protein
MLSRRPLTIAIAAATLHFGGCGEEPPPATSDDHERQPVAAAASGDATSPLAQSARRVQRRGICDGSAGIALFGGYLAVANDENNVLSIYQSDTGTVPVGRVQLSATLAVRGRPNREADIEAATTIGDTAYWITSHASTRRGAPLVDRHRLFAAIEYRTDSVPTVRPAGRVYGGLVNALLGDTALARHGITEASRRPPEVEGGLNVEGLAATPDGRLLIGFRNPVPEGRALVVPIENPADVIFRERPPRIGRAMTLALGGRGIRSIEYVPALRAYVIVAGSANGGRDFALYRWSGAAADAPRLVQGAPLDGLSPEAIVVDSAHPDRLLLLSDDGGRRMGGRECKDQDDSRKFFRSVVVPLPEG